MYMYPEDIKEIAVACRVYASKVNNKPEFDRWRERADALEEIANTAESRYGDRSTVSIDVSAARGYAIPMDREKGW